MNLLKNMDRDSYWTIYNWKDRTNFFAQLKPIGTQRQLGVGREKTLKFVYNLPKVKNPMSLFHVLIQSMLFIYLSFTKIESDRIAILSGRIRMENMAT
jgi:hypothetical protein